MLAKAFVGFTFSYILIKMSIRDRRFRNILPYIHIPNIFNVYFLILVMATSSEKFRWSFELFM